MAEQPADADVAQLVERNLAKVEVAGSNLVIRSNVDEAAFPSGEAAFVVWVTLPIVESGAGSCAHEPT